ncbi:sensor histidine kinase [Shewanella putrefaciens]|nr:sensor histidine kinase [Shewanella putrefaciens]
MKSGIRNSVMMEKKSISEPQTPLTQWQNSLPFKFSLVQLIIASI